MRVSGDVVFLHILEDSNGRLELAHVAQRARELNGCLRRPSIIETCVEGKAV